MIFIIPKIIYNDSFFTTLRGFAMGFRDKIKRM